MENKQEVANINVDHMMEKVLLAGDLSKMDPKDRISYYLRTCESMGMNPMTKPFDLITLNGKMILYPNRSGTDQLRRIGNVDTQIIDKGFNKETGCYVVTARAKLPSGRTDEDMGIVYCEGLKGDQLANAQLKAMTKAKRRVTLSIMGLGWIDESEVGSVKEAKLHKMDLDTGAVIDVQSISGKQHTTNQSEGEYQDKPEHPQPKPQIKSNHIITPVIQDAAKKMTTREETNKKLKQIYRPYISQFPSINFKTLLLERYQVEETRLITLEQLQDLVHFMEDQLKSKPIDISPEFDSEMQQMEDPRSLMK